MRDAGRDNRQRVEGLYQVSLRKTKVLDLSNIRGQPHSMAGSAIATLVARIVLASISAVVVRVNLGVCVVAHGRDRTTMIMVTAVRRGGHRHGRPWSANGHGCCRVALKRHRKHHEPQKDRAKADHRRIVVGQGDWGK